MPTNTGSRRRRAAGGTRPHVQRAAARTDAAREKDAPRLGRFAARWSASLTLLGAGVIHAAHAHAHLEHWALAGIFFVIVATVQGLLAAAFLLGGRPGRALVVSAIAASLGTVAVWVVSRTVGLPFGPGAGVPEAIGRADISAAILEIATAAALLPLLRRPFSSSGGSSRPLSYVAVGVLLAAVPLLTGLAVTGSALRHEHHRELSSAGFDDVVGAGEQAGSSAHHHDDVASPRMIPITARRLAFDTTRIEVEAGVASAIHLSNRDSVAHNISVYGASGRGAPYASGAVVPEGEDGHVSVRISRPGLYAFRCDLHPSMKGTVRVS
jgi:plastocyanin